MFQKKIMLILKVVFLECSSYEYGRNCENRCSYQCYNNETCDPFFGYCSRCADGYQNAKCDERKLLNASLWCMKDIRKTKL